MQMIGDRARKLTLANGYEAALISRPPDSGLSNQVLLIAPDGSVLNVVSTVSHLQPTVSVVER